ncbi:50S ribosomal protein L25 [Patescibacteria group bacterium]|nr:50S ribosomal protein L25 [Patescibacteria group bacterium]
MTQTVTLAVKTRTKAKKAAKHLLDEGKIPAVLYGYGVPSRSVEVEAVPFYKTLRSAGESTLVDLVVDSGEPCKVLIHDTQVDPLRQRIIHVDFLQVNMKEKLTTDISVDFVGESVAVKGLGGTLVKNHDHIPVECLPGDLVHSISVDISSLRTFEDVIRAKDIVAPQGVTFLMDMDEVIALVSPPRTEEEMKGLEGGVEASVDAVEVVEKKKKADDEKAEGEAAAK